MRWPFCCFKWCEASSILTDAPVKLPFELTGLMALERLFCLCNKFLELLPFDIDFADAIAIVSFSDDFLIWSTLESKTRPSYSLSAVSTNISRHWKKETECLSLHFLRYSFRNKLRIPLSAAITVAKNARSFLLAFDIKSESYWFQYISRTFNLHCCIFSYPIIRLWMKTMRALALLNLSCSCCR